MSKFSNHKNWISKNVGKIFVLAAVVVILSPYILTQSAIWLNLDFSNTGEIGDTIGGITAPIINLFAALLVYLAFDQQVKANDIQVKSLNEETERRDTDRKFDTVLNELNWCSENYEKIEFSNQFGLNAVDSLLTEHLKISTPKRDSEIVQVFQRILGLRNYLSKMIIIAKSVNSDQYRAILANKILLIHRSQTIRYKSKIVDYLSHFSAVVQKEPDELTSAITLFPNELEWLENQKFNFHTSSFKK